MGVAWTGQSWECVNDPITDREPQDSDTVCFVELMDDPGFRGVRCSDAAGFPVDFDVAMNIVNKDTELAQGKIVTDVRFDEYTKSRFFNWRRNNDGKLIQTFVQDDVALKHKYDAAKQLNLAGVGIWTLTKLNYSAPINSIAFNDTLRMWEIVPSF